MKDAIFYPKYNTYLAKNSEAYKLYVERKFEALDKHLDDVFKSAKKRGEII